MELLRFIVRNSKRLAVLIVGSAVVVAGLVMLALPGPGILVVFLGLAILATEFVWAAVALDRTKQAAATTGRKVNSAVRSVTRRR